MVKSVPVVRVVSLALLFALVACGGASPTSTILPPGDDAPGASSDGGSPSSAGDAGVSSDASQGGGTEGKDADAPIDASGPRGDAGGVVGPTGFTHPGVLVDKGQLDFVKAKIAAGAEPWKSASTKASASPSASATYTAAPIADVVCGSFSNPDIGCTAEKADAGAAYTHALLWYFTGVESHAKKAIEIMNAWSSTVKSHSDSNAPLQSAWVGSVWPRAAEIMRYTYAGWGAADVAAFGAMLKNVYLPQVINGAKENGNWELSMIEATLGIAVFLDDQATFDKAVSMWKKRVPAYIYLQSDGPMPVYPPSGNVTTSQQLIAFWYKQSTFMDGLAQETCRDLGHVQYGFAAMINAAETARIQGTNLYAAESKRIVAGLEFQAQYLNGAAVPATLCGGTLNAVQADPMWEIAYNEYANRESLPLPETKKLVLAHRPTGMDHHMAWETLTHAETGTAGIP